MHTYAIKASANLQVIGLLLLADGPRCRWISRRDRLLRVLFFFFFNDTATTEIYTLSLHDALPISPLSSSGAPSGRERPMTRTQTARSEEHTSELQSHHDLVCRLLLEKKKKKN